MSSKSCVPWRYDYDRLTVADGTEYCPVTDARKEKKKRNDLLSNQFLIMATLLLGYEIIERTRWISRTRQQWIKVLPTFFFSFSWARSVGGGSTAAYHKVFNRRKKKKKMFIKKRGHFFFLLVSSS